MRQIKTLPTFLVMHDRSNAVQDSLRSLVTAPMVAVLLLVPQDVVASIEDLDAASLDTFEISESVLLKDGHKLTLTQDLSSTTAAELNSEKLVIKTVSNKATGSQPQPSDKYTAVLIVYPQVMASLADSVIAAEHFDESNDTTTAQKSVEQKKVLVRLDDEQAQQVLHAVSKPVARTIQDFLQQNQGELSGNEVLQSSLTEGQTNDLDTIARFAVFGGAVESSLLAQSSITDVLNSHLAEKKKTAKNVAKNGQGSTLWVQPLYKTRESKGFSAQGIDYGTDIKFSSLALGGDSFVNDNLRLGVAFTLGMGDAEGKRAAAALQNDINYYGVALYSAYYISDVEFHADVNYTVFDNDLEAQLASLDEEVTADLSSTLLSFGTSATYHFEYDDIVFEPHLGLRYLGLDMDNYSVKGSAVYADYLAQRMDIITVPLGLTVSKDLVFEDWRLQPELDLTVTGHFGDTEAKGTVLWHGTQGLTSEVANEVLDEVTYGAKIKLSAEIGQLKAGLSLKYTGSENSNELGINAHARFYF